MIPRIEQRDEYPPPKPRPTLTMWEKTWGTLYDAMFPPSGRHHNGSLTVDQIAGKTTVDYIVFTGTLTIAPPESVPDAMPICVVTKPGQRGES